MQKRIKYKFHKNEKKELFLFAPSLTPKRTFVHIIWIDKKYKRSSWNKNLILNIYKNYFYFVQFIKIKTLSFSIFNLYLTICTHFLSCFRYHFQMTMRSAFSFSLPTFAPTILNFKKNKWITISKSLKALFYFTS